MKRHKIANYDYVKKIPFETVINVYFSLKFVNRLHYHQSILHDIAEVSADN